MGAVRTHKQKMSAKCAHPKVPSFVYRQDGHELSYMIEIIILSSSLDVKFGKIPLTLRCKYGKISLFLNEGVAAHFA